MSGFKSCGSCSHTMSVADPHKVCLYYLERDHDSQSCRDCLVMAPKALWERRRKLLEVEHLSPCRSRSSGGSRERSEDYHRSSGSKSSHSDSGKRRHKKKSKKRCRSPMSPLSVSGCGRGGREFHPHGSVGACESHGLPSLSGSVGDSSPGARISCYHGPPFQASGSRRCAFRPRGPD